MSEWIDINEQKPDDWEEVLIKTDCPDCPIMKYTYAQGEFVIPVMMQCDRHYETDQKFGFLKMTGRDEVEAYTDRITHWMRIVTKEETFDP